QGETSDSTIMLHISSGQRQAFFKSRGGNERVHNSETVRERILLQKVDGLTEHKLVRIEKEQRRSLSPVLSGCRGLIHQALSGRMNLTLTNRGVPHGQSPALSNVCRRVVSDDQLRRACGRRVAADGRGRKVRHTDRLSAL